MSGNAEPPDAQTPRRREGWQLPGPGVPGRPPGTVLAGGVAGEARNVSQGTIQGSNRSVTVVTFRLEQHDPSAGRTSMVTVRLYGSGAIGFVSDGDWVEVQGQPKHGFLNVQAAVNRTSGAEFQASPSYGKRIGIGCLLFALAWILSGLIIGLIAIGH